MEMVLDKRERHGRSMPVIPQVCTVLKHYVTQGYLMQLFRRKSASIFLWRNFKGMPYVEIPGDLRCSIRYDLNEIAAWAKENRIRMYPVSESG